jgi:hypothetical protein
MSHVVSSQQEKIKSLQVSLASILPGAYLLPGSGSLEKDSSVEIVAMEEEEKTRFVHHHRLGKRQRHADKAGQTLP